MDPASPSQRVDSNDLLVSTTQCVETELRQLMRGVTGLYDRELRRAGLRNSQCAVLSTLLETGPVHRTNLASALKLSLSTLSRNLRPLELAGWVHEQAVGDDRRKRLVSATKAGRRKWQESHEHWVAAQNTLTQTLGRRRVAALRGVIEDSLVVLGAATHA
jgi:DNA-binding MarR family transcriptional regulator